MRRPDGMLHDAACPVIRDAYNSRMKPMTLTLPRSRYGDLAVTLAAFAVFCATLTYWSITLLTPRTQRVDAPAAAAPIRQADAGLLFGGSDAPVRSYRLVGVLSLGRAGHAAAIVQVDGKSRVLAVGQALDEHATLRAVNADSIVLERDGQRESVPLDARPGAAAQGTVYVR